MNIDKIVTQNMLSAHNGFKLEINNIPKIVPNIWKPDRTLLNKMPC